MCTSIGRGSEVFGLLCHDTTFLREAKTRQRNRKENGIGETGGIVAKRRPASGTPAPLKIPCQLSSRYCLLLLDKGIAWRDNSNNHENNVERISCKCWRELGIFCYKIVFSDTFPTESQTIFTNCRNDHLNYCSTVEIWYCNAKTRKHWRNHKDDEITHAGHAKHDVLFS